MAQFRRLISYDALKPMTEAVDVGPAGNGERWDLPTWGPDEEVAVLTGLLSSLGSLDDDTRKLRAHVASLTGCDSGIPATIDEILEGIGRGHLIEPALRNGCDHPGFFVSVRSSQPRQKECMRIVHEVITSRLADEPPAGLVARYPFAEGFINHTYEWLPPQNALSEIQNLLIERMLLPFEFFLEASHADPAFEQACVLELSNSVMKKCYEPGGRGSEIDAEIERIAHLPKIEMAYPQQAQKTKISDRGKRELYVLCCSLAHGLHTLCDCHHSTFRWIENWVYAIGTGHWGIPTRRPGSESERLFRLMFGYLLGLDKWLLGIPEQFLLLDLGHIDLGLDPKNEIVRVYAYLGAERSPVKTWLAAYLWTNLMYNTGGPLWRNRHRRRLEQAEAKGVSIRVWMDTRLR